MKIINVPDLSPYDDPFTRLKLLETVDWVRLTGMPTNAFERRIKALKFSRYRGAVQAVLAAQTDDIIISHHPLMSSAVSLAQSILRRRARHVAFAFNFTSRPTGLRLKIMSRALSNVENLVVFSKYETKVYSDLFGLSQDKFQEVLWTQDPPLLDGDFRISLNRPYLCAIGGEGRDIDLVLSAARALAKRIDFVVVTRPHLLHGRSIPENVHVLANLPSRKTWALAARSVGVLVPLVSDDTCCGHITIVSAKQLGLPIVTTRAYATEEYVANRGSVIIGEPGDLDGFCQNINGLIENQDGLRSIAAANREQEIGFHSREKWAELLNHILFE